MISPKEISYSVFWRNGKHYGRLNSSISFVVGGQTEAVFNGRKFSCTLKHGVLTVERGSEWDFATGAIDTEDMKMASLLHDAYCIMYKKKKIPFALRRHANTLFRMVLEERGCPWIRRWYAYLAVSVFTYIGSD